jgi:hypothetical protein
LRCGNFHRGGFEGSLLLHKQGDDKKETGVSLLYIYKYIMLCYVHTVAGGEKIPPFFTDPERKRKTKVTCSKKKKKKRQAPFCTKRHIGGWSPSPCDTPQA